MKPIVWSNPRYHRNHVPPFNWDLRDKYLFYWNLLETVSTTVINSLFMGQMTDKMCIFFISFW